MKRKIARLLLLLSLALVLIVPANATKPTQVTTTASSGPANVISTQTVNGVT